MRLTPVSLVGSFAPAPRTRRLTVERREAGHWRRVGAVRTWAGGHYRTAVAGPGVYRVRAGTVAGPAVRVR